MSSPASKDTIYLLGDTINKLCAGVPICLIIRYSSMHYRQVVFGTCISNYFCISAFLSAFEMQSINAGFGLVCRREFFSTWYGRYTLPESLYESVIFYHL